MVSSLMFETVYSNERHTDELIWYGGAPYMHVRVWIGEERLKYDFINNIYQLTSMKY